MKQFTITYTTRLGTHTDRITGDRHTISEDGDHIILDQDDRWRSLYPSKCNPELISQTEAPAETADL